MPGILYFGVLVTRECRGGGQGDGLDIEGGRSLDEQGQGDKGGKGDMGDKEEIRFRKSRSLHESNGKDAHVWDCSFEIDWEKLFLVPIKKFEVYCDKIISFYEKLSREEFDSELEE